MTPVTISKYDLQQPMKMPRATRKQSCCKSFKLYQKVNLEKMRFLLLSLVLLGCMLNFSNSERDFNINESQVPLLEAKDDPKHTQHQLDPYVAELLHCHNTDNEIVLSLVLADHDWSSIQENKRQQIILKLSKFFAIPKEYISLETIGKREIYEMQKKALRKGPNKCKNKHNMSRVNLVLGCGDQYFSMAEPIVNQIGQQMRDGFIDNISGERFGWYIVWLRSMESRTHRHRRQALEGSGEDEYEDEYDYDGDAEEENNEPVTEIPAAATQQPKHAHRHHHGVPEVRTTLSDGMEQLPNLTTLSSATLALPTSETLTPQMDLSSTTTTSATPEIATPGTTSSTDYAEPRIENTPPLILTRLPKINVTAGKYFSTIVPENVFFDNEDATNLRLEFHDKDGHEMTHNSWVQFNSETREIYGLPVFETPSTYFYYLTATDSGNETVTETVEIKVMQHRFVRTFNHEINVTVKVNDNSIPYVDWQIKLIKGIASTLGDKSTEAIVAPEVRLLRQEPNTAVLAFFNESLSTISCPENELNDIVRRLDANRLNELVQPTLSIKSIMGELIGGCRKMDATATKPPTISSKNLPPVPRNQVDRVNATVGHLLVYPVPPDTFYDSNDNQLVLSLKTKDHRELSPRHWLQFDSKNQEFYGIPKSADIGTEEYLLVAEDSGGLTATDALVVVVSHAPKKEFSAYFKAYLAIRHEQFNANLQRKFVESISELFNDKATNYIQIRSVTTHHDSDGTIVNFYNTTLFKSHNRCPEEEIEAARNVYLTQDFTVRDRVKKLLGPELNLTNVQVIPLGSCHPQQDITRHDFIPPKIDEPLLKSSFSDDYFYTFILPAAIIVVMIIIASIIACCLHRRRRKSGKMELGDEEERKSFRAKGIPVIFQDELDEKPEMGNKSPIILKDEKPPLLPPSYNTSNMTGDNDVDEYVPPPAVVVGGREARGKSPATPSYRKPPPYVSP